MSDRPLLNRLSPASHRALMIWSISYAVNHRAEISSETFEKMRQGNRAEQSAARIFTLFGLDLPRK